MGAESRGDTTPVRVVMTQEQRETILRAVTKERDRARRRAGQVTKDLSGLNLYELSDADFTTILAIMEPEALDVTMSAHLWNQVSWALAERSRVADYWHSVTQGERASIVDQLEGALAYGDDELILET